jgi:hypothetical protein
MVWSYRRSLVIIMPIGGSLDWEARIYSGVSLLMGSSLAQDQAGFHGLHCNAMACLHWGSTSVRADRSLADRLICGRCGAVLQGGRGSSTAKRKGLRSTPRGLPWRLLALAGLTAAVALGILDDSCSRQRQLQPTLQRLPQRGWL